MISIVSLSENSEEKVDLGRTRQLEIPGQSSTYTLSEQVSGEWDTPNPSVQAWVHSPLFLAHLPCNAHHSSAGSAAIRVRGRRGARTPHTARMPLLAGAPTIEICTKAIAQEPLAGGNRRVNVAHGSCSHN